MESSKRNRFDQIFEMAKGRPTPPNSDTSFADSLYSQIHKRLQLNSEGDLEAIDDRGIRRYSPKDAKNVMSGLEYLRELHSHEILGYHFLPENDAEEGSAAPKPKDDRPTIHEQEIAHLSTVARMTYARSHRIIRDENKPPRELSNAEKLTQAREKLKEEKNKK